MTARPQPGVAILLLAGTIFAVATGSVRADAPRMTPLRQGAPVPIAAYGRDNPACREWTNGCVVCVNDDGTTHCSTPGIACLPAGITCKRQGR